MIDVVDRTCTGFIQTLFDENVGGELLLYLAQRDPVDAQFRPSPPVQLNSHTCLRTTCPTQDLLKAILSAGGEFVF